MQQELTHQPVHLLQPKEWASKPRKNIPNKYPADRNLKEAYEDYKKRVVPGSRYDIDWKTYKEICKAVVEEIIQAILYNADEVKLDAGLGTIRIKKERKDPHNPAIDYQASKEHNTIVYHKNLHTRGYFYRVKWWKRGCKVVNKKYYSFIPHRKGLQRKIKPALLAGYDYFE